MPSLLAGPESMYENNRCLALYGKDTLVVFYETFRSSYSYTRIGRIEEPAGLAQALGPGNARVAFTAR